MLDASDAQPCLLLLFHPCPRWTRGRGWAVSLKLPPGSQAAGIQVQKVVVTNGGQTAFALGTLLWRVGARLAWGWTHDRVGCPACIERAAVLGGWRRSESVIVHNGPLRRRMASFVVQNGKSLTTLGPGGYENGYRTQHVWRYSAATDRWMVIREDTTSNMLYFVKTKFLVASGSTAWVGFAGEPLGLLEFPRWAQGGWALHQAAAVPRCQSAAIVSAALQHCHPSLLLQATNGRPASSHGAAS